MRLGYRGVGMGGRGVEEGEEGVVGEGEVPKQKRQKFYIPVNVSMCECCELIVNYLVWEWPIAWGRRT